MIIAKQAIRNFLTRELADSAYVKDLSDKVLDRKIAAMNPQPRFLTEPRGYQKACFLLGIKHPGYQFLLDMGMGKTMVVLYLLAYWHRLGCTRRAIYLVPNTHNVAGTLEQVHLHTPWIQAVGLDGSKAEREEALYAPADIVVATYAGLRALVCSRVAGKKGKRKDTFDKKRYKAVCGKFDAVVFDEITAAKNSQSLTYRICNRLAAQCDIRYGLTGTSFGRDPEDLWAQFYLCDRGATLGVTKGIFRAAFFTAKKNFWSYGNEYTLNKKFKPLLARTLRHRSIRYREDEVQDQLPLNLTSVQPVNIPPETLQYYKRVMRELQTAHGNYQQTENAFMRMRQMCSGWAMAKGADETRISVRFGVNPKLDALVANIDETPADRKVIVFHDFTESGRIICERLRKEKISHVWLHGGGKKGVVEKFKEGRHKVLVSSTAGAFGGNWQIANYVFFFELPVSPILFRQMGKRAHRQGQTRTTFTRLFIVRGTVEEQIAAFQKEGKDLFEAIVDGKALPK